MKIRQLTLNEMIHFERMPKKDAGIRIILTHEFSKKIDNNQFNFILNFYKYTKCDIDKYSFNIIKNDGFFGQIGQNITKNSLCLEFDNNINKDELLSHFLYLAKIYNQIFIIYFYKEKEAFLVQNTDTDCFEKCFYKIIKNVKHKCFISSLSEINNLLVHDCLIIVNDKNSSIFVYNKKESYGITNNKYKISILSNNKLLGYLTKNHCFDYKLKYILDKKGNKLYKYDSSFNLIKIYKSLNVIEFIKRAFFKNISQIEKAEYIGISYKYAPHDVYKKVIMYQEL